MDYLGEGGAKGMLPSLSPPRSPHPQITGGPGPLFLRLCSQTKELFKRYLYMLKYFIFLFDKKWSGQRQTYQGFIVLAQICVV